MSTIYEEWNAPPRNTWIVYPGQLVTVRQNCFEQKGQFGIIIECACPNFGIDYDEEYWVLIDGRIDKIRTFMIYPVMENEYEQSITRALAQAFWTSC